MKKLDVIGRFLFAIPFGLLGINHFLMLDYYTGMVSTFLPGGGFTVIFTGLALIAAAISIILNKLVKLSCLLLALLLFIFIVTIHLPGLFGGGDLYAMHLIEFLKDTSLMGGALIIAGLYNDKK